MTAELGPSDTERWLVVGQSWSDGWTARLTRADSDIDLGEPQLVQGYANGWRLPALDQTTQVELVWTPQRNVTISLWISLAASILVLGLALFGPRGQLVLTPGGDPRFLGRSDQGVETRAWGLREAAMVVLVGLGAGLTATPRAGAEVALVMWVWTYLRRWPLAGLVGPLMLAATGAYIWYHQWNWEFPARFEWPQNFERAHVPTLIAMWLLFGAALIWSGREAPGKGGSAPGLGGSGRPSEHSDGLELEPPDRSAE